MIHDSGAAPSGLPVSTIIDSYANAFMVIGVDDYRITMANRTAGGVDVVGRTCHEISHGLDVPCDGEDHPCPLREVVLTGGPVTVSHVHEGEDGGSRHIEIHASPVFDGEGRVTAIIEVAVDVTGRVESAREMARQREILEQVFENSAYIVMLLDEDCRVVRINRAGSRSTAVEAVGRSVLCGDLFECVNAQKSPGCGRHPVCANCQLRGVVNRILEDGIPVSDREISLAVTRDGRTRPFHGLLSASIIIADGERRILITIADLTERKEMEKQIRMNEYRFRSLFETMADAVFIAELETGTILDANRKAEELTGRSLDGLKSMHQTDLHPPDILDRVRQQFRDFQALASRQILIRSEILHADGRRIPVEISSGGGFTIDGRECAVGVFRDISERKEFEEALKESREQFLLAVRGSNDGIFDWDIRTGVLYLSPRWKEMLGYEDHELENIVSTFEGLLHPGDHDRIMAFIDEYLKGDIRQYRQEFRMRHKDGSWVWILARGQAVRDENGVPVRMAGSHTDITERKLSEDAVRASEARYRALFEKSPDAYFIYDGLLVSDCNQAALDMLGGAREMVLGRKHTDFFPERQPDGRDSAAASGEHVRRLEAGETVRVEWQHRRLDGGLFWVDVRLVRLSLPEEPLRILATWRDISERKAAEERLQETNADLLRQQAIIEEYAKKAEAASRAKTRFLASMSHEIRTPMNGVLGMVQLLRDTPLSKEQAEYLDILDKSGRHLMLIINDVLDFSKIESGKLEMKTEPFVLQDMLDGALRPLEMTAREKGLDFRLSLDNALPVRVSGDPVRMGQVLINIVGNAVKFTDSGFVSIRIRGEVPEAGKVRIMFEVEDSGVGISEEFLARAFDPFTQESDSDTRGFGGTGLGLTISRRLVNAMGGEITVESTSGSGSFFRLEVPFSVVDAISGEKQVVISDEPFDLSCYAILLVEDNTLNQMFITTLIGKLGGSADVAANGREALSLLGKKRYDLVLMDCQMPVMDGFEATERIRRGEAGEAAMGIPVIALTANAFEEDRQRCLAAGMDDFLPKPVMAGDLQRMFSRWLGHQGIEYGDPA